MPIRPFSVAALIALNAALFFPMSSSAGAPASFGKLGGQRVGWVRRGSWRLAHGTTGRNARAHGERDRQRLRRGQDVTPRLFLTQKGRLAYAAALLGKESLSPKETETLLRAHEVGRGEKGKGWGKAKITIAGRSTFTMKQLGRKLGARQAEQAFSRDERKLLLKTGTAGFGTSMVRGLMIATGLGLVAAPAAVPAAIGMQHLGATCLFFGGIAVTTLGLMFGDVK